ncbi:hypothetical protein F5B20DRAFT_545157 [Whalleya microplaca]|nr:hypothetical protein F5B20DRAFT_545157 [Whalleya microplaca]
MAETAPGYEPERNEPRCYNCGLRGHMFMACPEDTRKIPAGLEASWARQQSNNSPRSDSPMNNKRSKGPVITRYPPPSSNPPPAAARFDGPPGQSYPPSSVPGYPPHPPYTTGYGNHIPPPPTPHPPYDRYGPPGSSIPPGPPPPPPPGAHQQFSPPPYHQGPYNNYGPSAPPPHGPTYGYHHGPPPGPPPERPSQYPSTDYAPGPPHRSGQYPPGYYPPGPPPGPPPPGPPYGPNHQYPPGPPHSYAPPPSYPPQPAQYGYNGPPPAYPPPDYGPPPPPNYQQYPPPNHPVSQPYGDDRNRHPRGRDHHRRYDNKSPAEAWPPQRDWRPAPPPDSQKYRDFDYRGDMDREGPYREERQPRRWDRGRSREEWSRDLHDQFQPHRNFNKADRHRRKRHRSVTTPTRTASREPSYLDLGGPPATAAPQDPEPGEIISEANSVSERGDAEPTSETAASKEEDDFDWELQAIFKEPQLDDKVDAVAAPLPTQYTEDVTIPPAFDAKSLKSKYINPTNVDDFALSIRDTKEWQVMQYHPTFLDPMEIDIESLDTYDRAIQMEKSFRNNRRDRHGNAHNFERHRHGNPFNNLRGSGRFHGKNRDNFHHKPNQKKRKWDEPLHGRDIYRAEKQYPDIPYEERDSKKHRAASVEDGEVIEADLQEPSNEKARTPTIPVDDPTWAPEPGEVVEETNPPASNHSNGNSTSNGEAQGRRRPSLSFNTKDEEVDARLGPHPPPPASPPPYSRPSSRRSSKSFHGSRPASRRSSFDDHVSEPGSPLDPIERELLGMGRPSTSGSDTGNGSPKRQFDDVTPKFKRRQPKVLEAYSRRW